MEIEWEYSRTCDGYIIFRCYELVGGWYLGTKKCEVKTDK